MAEVTSLIADFLSNSFASKSVTELETTVKTVLSSKNIQNSLKKTPTSERIISIEEVSWHDEPNDCWLIIFDKVYDVTNFLDEVSKHFTFYNFLYKYEFSSRLKGYLC